MSEPLRAPEAVARARAPAPAPALFAVRAGAAAEPGALAGRLAELVKRFRLE